ncbi:hypothetical protein XM38_007290 [Halomicronema hongdechloris C2206]|uniref:Nudix hydrolase domain-containing protein n=1 Tax=Halomicronema hongdechloris C2206 TaxID=1641165 RepID=A0A1Z3HHQ1_9CYAN|nr:NUDIX hydrolase [Halomicronema hongdechloris]ASC69800.1 hypothetical protein XM38_007290 [Halomicronema hongdechloris C2206]
MGNPPVEVAIAVLYQQGRFLLQLRDNIPNILYPGYWAFFGGHLEPGEDAFTGVKRELLEEIGYAPPRLDLFQRRMSNTIIRNVFHGPLTVPVESLQLNEGWDLGLCSIADVRRGACYSPKAQEERPLGPPHQEILLMFLEHYPSFDT